jgi:hypothetical protein
MKRYYVVAYDDNGEDVSRLVDALSSDQARRLFIEDNDESGDNWEEDGGEIATVWLLPPVGDMPKVLQYGVDAIELGVTGATGIMS